MTIGIQNLNDIPLQESQDLTSTLAHELGHVLHLKRFATMTPGKSWLGAIKKDGTSVSEYGDTKLQEDFAEAMRVYIQTDGGTKDPQALKDFANRFEILDNLMQKSIQERHPYLMHSKNRRKRKG